MQVQSSITAVTNWVMNMWYCADGLVADPSRHSINRKQKIPRYVFRCSSTKLPSCHERDVSAVLVDECATLV